MKTIVFSPLMLLLLVYAIFDKITIPFYKAEPTTSLSLIVVCYIATLLAWIITTLVFHGSLYGARWCTKCKTKVYSDF